MCVNTINCTKRYIFNTFSTSTYSIETIMNRVRAIEHLTFLVDLNKHQTFIIKKSIIVHIQINNHK